MSGHDTGALGWVAVGFAGLSAAILLVHLARRGRTTDPDAPIAPTTKLWLLLGLGVFPIASAGSANVAGFQATQSRAFCGSCHVMEPHANDSNDPKGTSLSSIHAKNTYFGGDNCYTCHKDYGMYGYVLTKMGGMRHVYLYLTEYRSMPLEKAKHDIRIVAPISNQTCATCHTMQAPAWAKVPDHASALSKVKDGTMACTSPGCHGFAHPGTKLGKELLLDGGAP